MLFTQGWVRLARRSTHLRRSLTSACLAWGAWVFLLPTPAKPITIDSAVLSATWDGRTSRLNVKNMISSTFTLFDFTNPAVFGTSVPDWAVGSAFGISVTESPESAQLEKGVRAVAAEGRNPDGTFTPHKETVDLSVTGHWFPDITAPEIEEEISIAGRLSQGGAGLACAKTKQEMNPFLNVLQDNGCSDQALGPVFVLGHESDTGRNPFFVQFVDDITVTAEITNRRSLGVVSFAIADFTRTLVEEGQVTPEAGTAGLFIAGSLAIILAGRAKRIFQDHGKNSKG